MEKEVVLDTIRKMVESGIDDATIMSTLQDVGLSETDIRSLLQIVKQGATKNANPLPTSKNNADEFMGLEEPSTDDLDAASLQAMQSLKNSSEEVGLAAAQLVNASEEQKNVFQQHQTQMQSMQSQVSDLHQKVSSIPSTIDERVKSIDQRLESMQIQLDDHKAMLQAFQDILKKVLDTNRSILIQLQKKM